MFEIIILIGYNNGYDRENSQLNSNNTSRPRASLNI